MIMTVAAHIILQQIDTKWQHVKNFRMIATCLFHARGNVRLLEIDHSPLEIGELFIVVCRLNQQPKRIRMMQLSQLARQQNIN